MDLERVRVRAFSERKIWSGERGGDGQPRDTLRQRNPSWWTGRAGVVGCNRQTANPVRPVAAGTLLPRGPPSRPVSVGNAVVYARAAQIWFRDRYHCDMIIRDARARVYCVWPFAGNGRPNHVFPMFWTGRKCLLLDHIYKFTLSAELGFARCACERISSTGRFDRVTSPNHQMRTGP